MFKVSARTVLELGSELISSNAIAFYELIKNGVDAGTKDGVTIKFKVVLARRDYLELRHTVNRLRKMPDNGNHAEDEFDFEEALAELLDETRARFFSDAGKLYDRAIEFLEDIDDLRDDLAGALKLAKEGEADSLPKTRGRTDAGKLKFEDDNVRQSFEYGRRVLGFS